jgi:hypothetical protein
VVAVGSLIPPEEIDALEGVASQMNDAVELILAAGTPIRWYVVRGHDAEQHIVLETSKVGPWLPICAVAAGFEWPNDADDWVVPAYAVDEERPWLSEAWADADPWFMTGRYEGPVPELIGRHFIDAASTHLPYLEALDRLYRRDGGSPLLRRRAEQQSASIAHAGARPTGTRSTTRCSNRIRWSGLAR